ncbi:MAG: inositol monophosphatase [Pseudomonadota bacterium]
MTQRDPPSHASQISDTQQAAIVALVRRTAQAEILPRFRNLSSSEISSKSSADDLVTQADIAAEEMLTRDLQPLFPEALIVGEEAVSRDPALREHIARAELAFILDPVDGTWNFAHGLPLFGVIVAATRFGQPVFGLLYDPVSDDWIIAAEDTEARLAGADRGARRVRASNGGPLDALSGYIHLDLLPRSRQAEMAARFPHFRRVTSLRCSCHEYRLLAQGAADFLISGTLNPWDHAAGTLIVQRAGGIVRMLDGQDYSTALITGHILAAPDERTWTRLRDTFAFLEAGG